MDYGVKKISLPSKTATSTTTDIKVNFWDLAGHPTFFDIRNEFYKDTQGVCCGIVAVFCYCVQEILRLSVVVR